VWLYMRVDQSIEEYQEIFLGYVCSLWRVVGVIDNGGGL